MVHWQFAKLLEHLASIFLKSLKARDLIWIGSVIDKTIVPDSSTEDASSGGPFISKTSLSKLLSLMSNNNGSFEGREEDENISYLYEGMSE